MDIDIINDARDYLGPYNVDIIIYHKNCQDGMTAAACGYIYYNKHKIHVDYIGYNCNDEVDISMFKNKRILVVDFSFNKENLIKIRSVCRKIMILDHHESARKELYNVEGCYVDIRESGATLAWKYFFPNEKIPRFVEYVKDRDIWIYKYREYSEPMYYGINYKLFKSFKDYVDYIEDDNKVDELIKIGKIEMNKNKEWIDDITHNYKKGFINIGGIEYYIVFLELYTPYLISEISEKLYLNHSNIDFTLCWYRDKDNTIPIFLENLGDYKIIRWLYGPQKYYVSLRTKKDHINLAEISKQLGGGGHVKAAGAVFDVIPTKRIRYM